MGRTDAASSASARPVAAAAHAERRGARERAGAFGARKKKAGTLCDPPTHTHTQNEAAFYSIIIISSYIIYIYDT